MAFNSHHCVSLGVSIYQKFLSNEPELFPCGNLEWQMQKQTEHKRFSKSQREHAARKRKFKSNVLEVEQSWQVFFHLGFI